MPHPVDEPAADRPFPWGEFLYRSFLSYWVMWLGVTTAGGVFGVFFFVFGAVFGLIFAGVTGLFTCVLGVLLHIALRGRAPLRLAASFSGATAGVFSWGTMAILFEPSRADWQMRIEGGMWPIFLVTATMGSLGAMIATSTLLRAFRKSELGHSMRDGQYSLADLMLFTTWLAVVMTACRLFLEPAPEGSYRDLILVNVTLFAMTVSEGLYRFKRWLSPHRADRLGPSEDALAAYWRRHDEQMAAIALQGEAAADERSP